jgi:hypothetical protein
MKLAIMQPYFFPYIGYFQLMNAVDEFVVYDNIQYTKKGWINRNRILVNKVDSQITLPLRKASDYLDVKDRYLADSWHTEKIKMLNRIKESYRKAPQFNATYPIVEHCLLFKDNNLFNFIFNSLKLVKEYLEIQSSFIVSSMIKIDHTLKAEKKVLTICKELKADIYVNPIGGTQLYDKNEFQQEKISLYFLKTDDFIYKQFDHEFIPSLSIIDLMMFNTKDKIREYLNFYKFI